VERRAGQEGEGVYSKVGGGVGEEEEHRKEGGGVEEEEHRREGGGVEEEEHRREGGGVEEEHRRGGRGVEEEEHRREDEEAAPQLIHEQKKEKGLHWPYQGCGMRKCRRGEGGMNSRQLRLLCSTTPEGHRVNRTCPSAWP